MPKKYNVIAYTSVRSQQNGTCLKSAGNRVCQV